jgi:hypothetical protein
MREFERAFWHLCQALRSSFAKGKATISHQLSYMVEENICDPEKTFEVRSIA